MYINIFENFHPSISLAWESEWVTDDVLLYLLLFLTPVQVRRVTHTQQLVIHR